MTNEKKMKKVWSVGCLVTAECEYDDRHVIEIFGTFDTFEEAEKELRSRPNDSYMTIIEHWVLEQASPKTGTSHNEDLKREDLIKPIEDNFKEGEETSSRYSDDTGDVIAKDEVFAVDESEYISDGRWQLFDKAGKLIRECTVEEMTKLNDEWRAKGGQPSGPRPDGRR